ncbi:hypothetical protein BGX38DRAFT_694254 [Terfezia claveryi]|nr:hypothetical protein BGX38DRAFT_694254 [Terfezia claveryi]
MSSALHNSQCQSSVMGRVVQSIGCADAGEPTCELLLLAPENSYINLHVVLMKMGGEGVAGSPPLCCVCQYCFVSLTLLRGYEIMSLAMYGACCRVIISCWNAGEKTLFPIPPFVRSLVIELEPNSKAALIIKGHNQNACLYRFRCPCLFGCYHYGC